MVIEKSDWSPNEDKLSEARNTLLKHYTDLQTAQGTRLIGFVAGLFALLQLTLTANTSGASQIFANSKIPVLTDWVLSLPSCLGELAKAIVLLMATSVILFFIVRTILRYAIYGYIGYGAVGISEDDMRQYLYKSDVDKPATELSLLDGVLTRYVHCNKKPFFVPANLIVSVSDLHPDDYPDKTKRGYIYLGLLSLFLSILLLLLVW